jgi:3-methylfumaryl-CoA hydratase
MSNSHGKNAIVASVHECLDVVDVFLFSAACELPHRIHYDAEFAKEEGLAGVPIQGPFQGALLAQLVQSWAAPQGAALRSMSFRHLAPLYVGEGFTCSAMLSEESQSDEITNFVLGVEVVGDDGIVRTRGVVEVVTNNTNSTGVEP